MRVLLHTRNMIVLLKDISVVVFLYIWSMGALLHNRTMVVLLIDSSVVVFSNIFSMIVLLHFRTMGVFVQNRTMGVLLHNVTIGFLLLIRAMGVLLHNKTIGYVYKLFHTFWYVPFSHTVVALLHKHFISLPNPNFNSAIILHCPIISQTVNILLFNDNTYNLIICSEFLYSEFFSIYYIY